jgi:hypothetical protein
LAWFWLARRRSGVPSRSTDSTARPTSAMLRLVLSVTLSVCGSLLLRQAYQAWHSSDIMRHPSKASGSSEASHMFEAWFA